MYSLRPSELLDPSVLERNYRDLRRSLEAAGNHSAASDFFYGEMQARRRQLKGLGPERMLLSTYHLISEHGTRAWRSLVSWFLLSLVASDMLLLNGLDLIADGEYVSRSQAWKFVLAASTSIFRPQSAPYLSSAETVIATAVRILGPALLAIAAIAIRHRTKR